MVIINLLLTVALVGSLVALAATLRALWSRREAVAASEGRGEGSQPMAAGGGGRRCPSCGSAQPAGSRFCADCGRPLEVRTCPTCGCELVGEPRFCGGCGAALGGKV